MKLSLKAARVDAGLTQVDLAQTLKCNVSTYRKIEENPDSATIEQARKIADAVGRPYDEIFFLPAT